MKNKLISMGILSIVLVFGFVLAGCYNGSTNDEPPNTTNTDGYGESLPSSKGENEMKGKTVTVFPYFYTFAENGTFTIAYMNGTPPSENGTSTDYEEGNYTFNSVDKKAYLKAVKHIGDENLVTAQQMEAELRLEFKDASSERFREISQGKCSSLDEYVNMILLGIYSPKTFTYHIENNQIASFTRDD